ncbi:MAG: vWA domain-containing protein [Methylophilus sp.]|nr:vWA domain-containing protein [Methylophilus sp.]
MFSLLNELRCHEVWPLYLVPLALLPWWIKADAQFQYPSISMIPHDPFSVWVERVWRISAALLITSLLLAMCKPYLGEQKIDRYGNGAHIMVVLDRSGSMNDDFADRPEQGSASKMAAARRVLTEFTENSRQDLIGMITFSTSPMLVAALGNDRKAVLSGLSATEAGGMGFTAVDKGLAMALDFFEGKPVTGSRVVLLVSDGAAHLDAKTQDFLRNGFVRQQASLFWIYLRSKNGASLNEKLAEDDDQAAPEYALNQYFQTLGVPYQAYMAEDPAQVNAAMQSIAKLKNKPVKYQEVIARKDMGYLCYMTALLATVVMFGLYLTEVRTWRINSIGK